MNLTFPLFLLYLWGYSAGMLAVFAITPKEYWIPIHLSLLVLVFIAFAVDVWLTSKNQELEALQEEA